MIYIEVVCDTCVKNDRDPVQGSMDRPMGRGEGFREARKTLAHMRKGLIDTGWKKLGKGKWQCPGCRKVKT